MNVEAVAKRLLELLKEDAELRKAVLNLLEATTDAKRALAEMRRRKVRP